MNLGRLAYWFVFHRLVSFAISSNWPAATSINWHDFFLWLSESFLGSFFLYNWLWAMLILKNQLVWLDNKALNIRNRQSTSSISTEWSIWLVDCLLKPPYKLTPNVLAIVFFLASVGVLTLTDLVHLGIRAMLDITPSHVNLIALTSLIDLALSEVLLSVCIHHQDVAEGWDCHFCAVYTPEDVRDAC